MYTPKCLQLFAAPIEDLLRMKRDWEEAASEGAFIIPSIAQMQDPISASETEAKGVKEFERICDEIEAEQI